MLFLTCRIQRFSCFLFLASTGAFFVVYFCFLVVATMMILLRYFFCTLPCTLIGLGLLQNIFNQKQSEYYSGLPEAETSKRDTIWLERDLIGPLAGTNTAFVFQVWIRGTPLAGARPHWSPRRHQHRICLPGMNTRHTIGWSETSLVPLPAPTPALSSR
jgi:hypothetical protein